MSLKQRALAGMQWSFIDNASQMGLQFVIGIILARLLSPAEFGLIGMLTIFIAISQSFIDSGFSQALIRKTEATQRDYSTVFYFNIAVAALLYLILYFSSGKIAAFFDEPILQPMVKVLGLSLLIISFQVIQRTILVKRINFRLQAQISVSASLISGGIGIYMALHGYGVWSLVTKIVLLHLITTLLLWIFNAWRPTMEFSITAFKSLFGFGSKILASGLLNVLYQNIYLLVIGKTFSAQELGYYTRANQFKKLPSENLTMVIQRVSYPLLSDMQDDLERLKQNYRRLVMTSLMVASILMLGMAAVAEPMIQVILGEKWMRSAVYLQLLCFVGMLYPLHALNLNILKVQGRSDLYLRVEVIKKLLTIPVIIIGIKYGILTMLVAMIVNGWVAYVLNSWWSGSLIGYSTMQQLQDIFPYFLIAFFIASATKSVQLLSLESDGLLLAIQLLVGFLLTVCTLELFKPIAFVELKSMLLERFRSTKEK